MTAFFVCFDFFLLIPLFNSFSADTFGTDWPILCWCAVKQLLTHSADTYFHWRRSWGIMVS